MQSWIKIAPVDDIQPSLKYFIGKRCGETILFYSRDIKGKMVWSCKPGIAVQAPGDEKLRHAIANDAELVAVQVPKNAATRWRARSKKRNKR